MGEESHLLVKVKQFVLRNYSTGVEQYEINSSELNTREGSLHVSNSCDGSVLA